MLYKKPAIKILIIIDNLNRELLGFLKLKEDLEKKNYKIKFANKVNFIPYFNFYKPQIVLAGQLWKTPGLKECKKNCKLFYLRAESCSGLINYIKVTYDDLSEVIPHYFCCWGPKEYNYLKKKIKNTKVILTGYPLNEIIPRKKNKVKVIGFATTLRNITTVSRRNIISDLKSLKNNKEWKNNNPFVLPKYDVSALYAYEINFLSKMIEIINKLKKKHKILIRIHPFEDKEIYKNLIEKNVELDTSKTFFEYCNKIDVLLAYKSSIQMYAYQNKIKVINLENILEKDFLKKLNPEVINMPFDKYFKRPKNLNMLLKEIKEPFKQIKNCESFLKNYFNYTVEKKKITCADQLIKEFENINFNKVKFNRIKNHKFSKNFLIQGIYLLLPGRLKYHYVDLIRLLKWILIKSDIEVLFTYTFFNYFKIKELKKIFKNI